MKNPYLCTNLHNTQKAMINRLLIRTKTVQLTYACLQSGEQRYASEQLREAIEASQKLHNYLLALIVKVTDYRREQIEAAKNKWLPTQEDLNQNMRLVENRVARLIKETSEVEQTCLDEGLMSDFDTELYRDLLTAIEENETYQAYCTQAEEPTFTQDKELWVELLSTVFAQCDKLDEVMEDRNIYWNDDLATVLQATTRFIRNLKPATEIITATKSFKNEEDRQFSLELFKHCIDEYYDNVRLINTVAPNWESERMALMDKVVMSCALSEIRNFPDIAVAISINEYIELAKHYCSPNSARFINGILDRIVKDWRQNHVITKA